MWRRGGCQPVDAGSMFDLQRDLWPAASAAVIVKPGQLVALSECVSWRHAATVVVTVGWHGAEMWGCYEDVCWDCRLVNSVGVGRCWALPGDTRLSPAGSRPAVHRSPPVPLAGRTVTPFNDGSRISVRTIFWLQILATLASMRPVSR